MRHHGAMRAAVTRAHLLDAVLVLLVLTLQVTSPHAGGVQASSTAHLVAGAAAIAQALVLLQRRRRPHRTALVVITLYAVQVLVVDVVPPAAAAAAVWALATYVDERRTALQAAGGGVLAVLAVIAIGELAHPGTGASALLGGVTVVVGLVALLRRTERGRIEALRAEAATAERLRIAQDLHDLAGHGLGAVAVQSSTARMALDAGDSQTARTALVAVESSTRSALREMRQLLGVLRDPATADGQPAQGLDELEPLVAGVRAGGVDASLELDVSDVSPDVALCTYRVVREAVTNAVKHSPGSSVRVRVQQDDGALHVEVRSRGRAVPGSGGGTGSGLDGIRARVAAAGGTSRIGPTADGWLVDVELPL